MADLKISALPEITTPANADVFAIAVDLLGTPVTKKITLANLITAINKPAGASGNVQFNSAGVFGGDNGLFWDNVNKRLGIGTTGPGAKLHIVGSDPQIRLSNTEATDIRKLSTLVSTHYSTAEEPIGMIRLDSQSSASDLFIGGGTSTVNAATSLSFYTAANTTTTTGTQRMRISSAGLVTIAQNLVVSGTGDTTIAGNVGIGTVSPTISDGIGLHLAGKILRIGTAKTPATAGAAGNAGEICWDANYLYLAIATNTWRRMAHATW